jgi:hypothetical protein
MNVTAPLEPRAWTARRWWTMVILVLVAHFALVFIFGAKHAPPARPASRVPFLKLTTPSDAFMALNDPTLFALPHANDFASANLPPLVTSQPPSFHWQGPPAWLPLSPEFLTKTFTQFMATNHSGDWALNFKPAPQFSDPEAPPIPDLPSESAVHLRGDLARHQWLNPQPLPDWPSADLLAPSKIQVVVDPAGRVLSAVLMPPDYGTESATRDHQADQTALHLARAARFTPAPQTYVGQMIFNWHAIPLPATSPITNAPTAQP